jgi:hypothetical protein
MMEVTDISKTLSPTYQIIRHQIPKTVILTLSLIRTSPHILFACLLLCCITFQCSVTLLTLNKVVYSITELPWGTEDIARSV